MYKDLTKAEYTKMLSLPDDYQVDGFITYGSSKPDKFYQLCLEILPSISVDSSTKRLEGFLSYILEISVDEKIFWFATVYGGAMLSEYTHLASLFGSKNNIHIGSCGGLDEKIMPLDIIIPTYSYGNESTTRSYRNSSQQLTFPSNERLSKKLHNHLSSSLTRHSGSIMTTQAMLGETKKCIDEWVSNNYSGVEMETSTMFAVSGHFGVPSGAILVVGDHLVLGSLVGSESYVDYKYKIKEIQREILKAGLEVLISDYQ